MRLFSRFFQHTKNIVLLGIVAVAALFFVNEDARATALGTLVAKPMHGLPIRGVPKYSETFKFFAYVDPKAPKGGEMNIAVIGTYDNFNYLIPKGTPAAGEDLGQSAGGTLLLQQLLSRAMDEPFTMYGQLAKTVTTPEDRSWVQFDLHPDARWHDGTPVTVDDVIFSIETMREKGTPNRRMFYGKVNKIERIGDRGVRFYFEKSGDGYDREWPLVLGLMSVISKNYYTAHPFDETTLTPPMGSGPYRITDVDPGRAFTYERVKDFWGKELPVNVGRYNFDRIRYIYFRNEKAAFEAFKAGDIDFWNVKDPASWVNDFNFPAVKEGKVLKKEVPHQRPAGMYGFVFNTRRDIFKDIRVRKALNEVFDFEWINKNLFHNGYTRTKSYFANTTMGASGLPTPGEIKLLKQYQDKLPKEIFEAEFTVSKTDGAGNNRAQIKQAQDLLKQAGWSLKGQKLINDATGKPFIFEILLSSPSDEKLALAYARNLKQLGIEVKIRTVDAAQYQSRLNDYDYDMIIVQWSGERSPGNAMRARFHSVNADEKGSTNFAGTKDPVLDALIDKMTSTTDDAEYKSAVKALDRALLWGYYVVPLYHSSKDLIAYWNRFGHPPFDPIIGTMPQVIWWQTKTMTELKKS